MLRYQMLIVNTSNLPGQGTQPTGNMNPKQNHRALKKELDNHLLDKWQNNLELHMTKSSLCWRGIKIC